MKRRQFARQVVLDTNSPRLAHRMPERWSVSAGPTAHRSPRPSPVTSALGPGESRASVKLRRRGQVKGERGLSRDHHGPTAVSALDGVRALQPERAPVGHPCVARVAPAELTPVNMVERYGLDNGDGFHDADLRKFVKGFVRLGDRCRLFAFPDGQKQGPTL